MKHLLRLAIVASQLLYIQPSFAQSSRSFPPPPPGSGAAKARADEGPAALLRASFTFDYRGAGFLFAGLQDSVYYYSLHGPADYHTKGTFPELLIRQVRVAKEDLFSYAYFLATNTAREAGDSAVLDTQRKNGLPGGASVEFTGRYVLKTHPDDHFYLALTYANGQALLLLAHHLDPEKVDKVRAAAATLAFKPTGIQPKR